MEDFDDTFDEINTNYNIEIWIENRGKKSDTYLSGWILDDKILKEHLKTIKKKLGCNGTITEKEKDGKNIKVMQLQGNKKNDIINYLLENEITTNQIKIIGV
jgi:translation initiation factor 1 (eIF-1/SUI1)